MKFLADPTLGKLVKWLRILGFDTIYYRGDIDRNFLRKAQRERRIVLTRKKNMTKRSFSGRMVLISEDNPQRQVAEVIYKLTLKPEPDSFFSLCLTCNRVLKKVSKRDVEGSVPDFVSEKYSNFKMCPQCGNILWPGTHRDNMLDRVRKILNYLPE